MYSACSYLAQGKSQKKQFQKAFKQSFKKSCLNLKIETKPMAIDSRDRHRWRLIFVQIYRQPFTLSLSLPPKSLNSFPKQKKLFFLRGAIIHIRLSYQKERRVRAKIIYPTAFAKNTQFLWGVQRWFFFLLWGQRHPPLRDRGQRKEGRRGMA